jgi:hypothetical protein
MYKLRWWTSAWLYEAFMLKYWGVGWWGPRVQGDTSHFILKLCAFFHAFSRSVWSFKSWKWVQLGVYIDDLSWVRFSVNLVHLCILSLFSLKTSSKPTFKDIYVILMKRAFQRYATLPNWSCGWKDMSVFVRLGRNAEFSECEPHSWKWCSWVLPATFRDKKFILRYLTLFWTHFITMNFSKFPRFRGVLRSFRKCACNVLNVGPIPTQFLENS